MNTFKDAQNKAQTQMEASQKEAELREITKDLSQAARDLATTNQNQLMQMQQQAQQSSMQTQSINNLSAAVSSSQGTGSRIAQAAQPAVNAAGTVAGVGAGMMGSHLGNRAEQVRAKSMDFFHRYNTMNNRGAPGAQPGFLGLPNNGMGSSLFHGSGVSWNPASAQNYTFGAYQRAASYNMGTNAEAYARAGITGGLGMLSMENAGNVAGGFMGPASIIASPALGMVGRGMDLMNPLSYGIKQSGRAAAFGATAAPDAHQFLRGAGAGQSVGSLSLQQQAKIGSGVQKLAQKDMMYSNEDIMGLQTDFAQSGQFLGVQNAEQYERRMKKLMDTHKSIMKTLQVTTDEAMAMMDEMFSTIGIDHGQEMSQMMTRMYSSAHLAGMSPQQMMQVGVQGAQMGRGAGLMSSTGSRMAMSARGLAGLSATNAMPTNLLATVGGESGLGNLIAQQNMQFAGGTGGTLMALTGGNMGGDVQTALSRATGNLQGGGDIVNLLANKHSMMDKFSPEMTQAQNANMLSSMAEQMGSGMGSVQDRMKLLLQSRGMDAAGADAYVRSIQELPEQMKREQLAQQQAISDQKKDVIAEQRSIRGRITYGFREFMGETMGGNRISERINQSAAEFGEGIEIGNQNLFDTISGADQRTRYTSEGAERIRKRIQKGEDVLGVGEGEGGDAILRSKTARKMKALQNTDRGKWGGTFFGNSDKDVTNRAIQEAIGSGSVEKMQNIVRTLRSDQRVQGGSDFAFTDDKGAVASEEVLGMLDEFDTSDLDKDEMKNLQKMKEQLTGKEGESQKFGRDRRQEMAMEMFSGGISAEENAALTGLSSMMPPGLGGLVKPVGDLMARDMFGVNKQDMEYSVGKEAFQEIMLEADQLFNIAKQHKGGEAMKGSEDKIMAIADRIKLKYKKVSDPKLKDVIKKTLKRKDIQISEDGEVNVTSLLDKVHEGDIKGDSLFQSRDGSNMRGLFDAVGTEKDREQATLAVREGFGVAMGKAGVDSELDLASDSTGVQARREFESKLAMLGDKDIEKLEGGDALQRNIAKLAKQTKSGAKGEQYQSNVRNVLDDITVAGLDVTAEGTFYDEKFDPEKIGANVSQDMAITTSNLQQTVKILDEVTKRMNID